MATIKSGTTAETASEPDDRPLRARPWWAVCAFGAVYGVFVFPVAALVIAADSPILVPIAGAMLVGAIILLRRLPLRLMTKTLGVVWLPPEAQHTVVRDTIDLARAKCGLGSIRVGLIESEAINAFTFGFQRAPRIVLTTAALRLPEEQLRAVVAHELGHIVNRDYAWMTAAAAVPALLTLLSRLMRNHNPAARATGILAWVLRRATLPALLLFSRLREFGADAFAAKLLGDGQALVDALVSLATQVPDKGLPKKKQVALAALGPLAFAGDSAAAGARSADLAEIFHWESVNPWARFYELAATHPRSSSRVASLLGMRTLAPPFRRWARFVLEAILRWSTLVALLGLWLSHWEPLLFVLLASVAVRLWCATPRGFRRASVRLAARAEHVSPVVGEPVVMRGKLIAGGDGLSLFFVDASGAVLVGTSFLDFFLRRHLAAFGDEQVLLAGWIRRDPIMRVDVLYARGSGGSIAMSAWRFVARGWWRRFPFVVRQSSRNRGHL